MSLRARDHSIGESGTCPIRSTFAATKQNSVTIVEDHLLLVTSAPKKTSGCLLWQRMNGLMMRGRFQDWKGMLENTFDNTVETKVECQWMDLSVCSAGGFTQSQTMKLEGLI